MNPILRRPSRLLIASPLLLTACGGSHGTSTVTDAATAPPDGAIDAGASDSAVSLHDAAVPHDAHTATPDSAVAATDAGVVFSIDVTKGPNRQWNPLATPTPISPCIYGVNAGAAWENTTKWGLIRQGGNANTAWNWTNNYSNSANDYCYWEGQESGGGALAGLVTTASGATIPTAQSNGSAFLATVPILDFVSATYSNNTGDPSSASYCCDPSSSAGCHENLPTCASGTANWWEVNTGNLPFAAPDAGGPAFVPNSAAKASPFCTCSPGGTCATGCTVNASGPVYQDEFVNYLKVTYGSSASPIFFSLDNEPNYWPSTHPELWPHTGTPGCGTAGTVTSDQIVARNSTYAAAIKNAWPASKVFGPVVAQDGIFYGGDYTDPALTSTTFSDYYLAKMAAASTAAGKSLIDSFDVHYYTSNGTADQCMQVPRMFWDPNFTTFSASTTDSIDFGWSGQNNEFDTTYYPRQMIPRLLTKVASAYSKTTTGTPGLSFSEYNAGCEQQIQGGVAEADLLGIFGREGVFAATAWPLQSVTSGSSLVSYLVGAFDLYRNYDGKGGVVGDTAVSANTSNIDATSIYAFTSSKSGSEVDLVAINKTSGAITATIQIAHAPALATASLFQQGPAAPTVAAVNSAPSVSCSGGTCSLTYTLPPTSATTITLR